MIQSSTSVRFQKVGILLIVAIFATLSASRSLFGDDFCAVVARQFSENCFNSSFTKHDSILNASIDQARSQGRFYQIFVYSITQIIIGNGLMSALSKILFSAAICYQIYRIAKWFLGSRPAVAALILFVTTYPLLGYNPLTNLPGWFNLGLLAFLVCLEQLLLVYFDSKGKAPNLLFLYLGLVLSIFTYELYIAIYLTFFALVLSLRFLKKDYSSLIWSRFQRRVSITILFTLFIYLSVYLLYRGIWPGDYNGTEISGFSPIAILRTLLILSFGGFILSAYSGIVPLLKSNSEIEITGLVSFSSIGIVTLLIALMVTIFALFFIKKSLFESNDVVLARTGWYLLIVLIVSPNILLALTERYQIWTLAYPFYLSTINSHIFIVISIVAMANRFIGSNQVRLRIAILLLIPLLSLDSIGKASYLTEALDFNRKLAILKGEAIRFKQDPALTDSEKAKRFQDLDRVIGAYPTRFFEAIARNTKSGLD